MRIGRLLYLFAALLAGPVAFGAETAGIQAERPSSGRFVECERGFMVAYQQTIPGTKITFTMTPVPGGVVEVGAGPNVDGADLPSSPPKRVRLEPYWVATHEITWREYWKYMELDGSFTQIDQLRTLVANRKAEGQAKPEALGARAELAAVVGTTPSQVDGITAPTPLYDPSTTYMSGEEPLMPAVSMTPYAAKQYTKWLSTITGSDYRLPSEAEWEHAALAGGATPLGTGEEGAIDADSLDSYAWHTDNADYVAHEVGGKKPNAWGLYDVLGNAAELVLDQHDEATEKTDAGKVLSWSAGVAWPNRPSSRVAKGGYYDSEAADCRVTSRLVTNDEDWKYSDPNFPKSPWWYSDDPAMGVGFRLVRPLKPMSEATKKLVWGASEKTIREDIASRLEEGRGKLQAIDKDLPKAIEQLNERDVQKLLN